MYLKSSIVVLSILKLSLIHLCTAERAKDHMYEHFDAKASCFRRLNATHQVGCSSKREGSTGILHLIEEQADLDFILKKGSAGNYIPIIPTVIFLIPKTLISLKQSDKISGVILYSQNGTINTTSHYSLEQSCPNSDSNIEKTCDVHWNVNGTGVLHEDMPFPIYYVDNYDDLNKLTNCFHKFNNYSYETQYTRSLCSIELNTFMHATTNTPTCMRRSHLINFNPVKFCDPLGDRNAWSSLFPIGNFKKTEVPSDASGKYIILAARLDTTSLFNALYPGAVSPVTGIVTLLATADLLKRMVGEVGKYEKNVLFMLFNGESYDYIGSQRMVYDMEHDEFPMKIDTEIKDPPPLVRLNDISLFVEISQLTKINSIYTYLADNNTDSMVKSFLKKLEKNGKFTKLILQNAPLPPASLQSFLKARPNMSGLILADHGSEYVNKYYNSIYDNVSNLNYTYLNLTENAGITVPPESIQAYVANVSTMLAYSLYEEVMNNDRYYGPQRPRLDLIDELFNCYLLDRDCKVHQAVQREKLRNVPDNSYSFYVGVTQAYNVLTSVIGLTLAWLTGDITSNKTCVNDPNTPIFHYINMSKSLDNLNTTACFRTTMNLTEAVSPAFIIEDYDWNSGKYSSWSESQWRDFSVRMFLKPSAAHERFTIAIGSITLVMSLIFVYFVKSRSHILFVTPENCSPTSC